MFTQNCESYRFKAQIVPPFHKENYLYFETIEQTVIFVELNLIKSNHTEMLDTLFGSNKNVLENRLEFKIPSRAVQIKARITIKIFIVSKQFFPFKRRTKLLALLFSKIFSIFLQIPKFNTKNRIKTECWKSVYSTSLNCYQQFCFCSFALSKEILFRSKLSIFYYHIKHKPYL